MSSLNETAAVIVIGLAVATGLGIQFKKASEQVDTLANITIQTADNTGNPAQMELARLQAEANALVAARQAGQ